MTCKSGCDKDVQVVTEKSESGPFSIRCPEGNVTLYQQYSYSYMYIDIHITHVIALCNTTILLCLCAHTGLWVSE